MPNQHTLQGTVTGLDSKVAANSYQISYTVDGEDGCHSLLIDKSAINHGIVGSSFGGRIAVTKNDHNYVTAAAITPVGAQRPTRLPVWEETSGAQQPKP